MAFYDATKIPQRKQVSLKVAHYRVARKKADELLREYEDGGYSPWEPRSKAPQEVALKEAVRKFIVTRQNLSPQSIQKYESVLGQFLRWAPGNKTLNEIDSDDIQHFINSGNRKPVTKKSYSTTLSPFFNWCIEQEWKKINPVTGIRLPRVQQGLPKTVSKLEINKILETIDLYDNQARRFPVGSTLWMKDAILLAACLGLRASELCQLRWEDIDTQNLTIRVGGRPGFKTKNAQMRLLPLTVSVRALLENIAPHCEYITCSSSGKNLSARYLSVRFKFFIRLAGLPESICLHCLRHTACTSLIEGGAPLEAVRKFMGHSSIRVTQRYIHLADDVYIDVINRAMLLRQME